MAIDSDFAIDYGNKRVYHFNGATVYTVRQLYSWLMDAFDEQATIDDTIPMTAQTPTEYTMVNSWFIDDVSTHFLKEGAIKTDGYLNNIQIVPFGATYTNCIPADIGKMVQVGGVDAGALLSYNNTAKKWWVRTGSGTPIPNGSLMTIIPSGSGAGTTNADSVDGEDLFANIYTLGTIEATGLIYIAQAGAVVEEADDWWAPDAHIDILFKVKEAGTEIAGAVITVYLRVWTDLYDFYEIDLSAGGRNAVPLATFNDPDNQTAIASIMNYLNTIQVMFANGELAYTGKAGNDPIKHMCLHDQTSHATAFLLNTGGGAGATGTFELADVEGTFGDINTIEICEELRFDTQTTQFVVGETIKNAANGSTKTAIVRKITQDLQANGVKGRVFVTGVTGTWVDDDPIYSGATQRAVADGAIVTNTFTATVNGTITIDNQISKDLDNGAGSQPYNVVIDLNNETVAHMYEVLKAFNRRECTIQLYTCNDVSIAKLEGRQYQRAMSTYALKKASPLGTFAGGKFFGARGVWIESMIGTDSEAYSLIDALGATQNPPTMSTIKVVSMVATNDRVLVCESTGIGLKVIKKNQYTATVQSGDRNYIEVSGAIADDAPTTGVVRVVRDYGTLSAAELIFNYTSIDRSGADDKFMVSPNTTEAFDAGDRAYNPYIDTNADGGGEKEVTVKYAGATKYLVAIVRYKGYIPFDVAGIFPMAGVTVTAIRTTDAIYQP